VGHSSSYKFQPPRRLATHGRQATVPASPRDLGRLWNRWGIVGLGAVVVAVIAGVTTAVAASGNGSVATVPVVTTPTSPFPTSAPVLPAVGPSVTSVYRSVICPAASNCVAVGQSSPDLGTISVSADGGSSWSVSQLAAAVPPLTSVACGDPTHCVSVGQGVVLDSQDGGTTWQPGTLPSSSVSLQGVACISAMTCMADGRGPATMDGLSGVILQTTDGGATWHQAEYPLGTPALDALACASVTLCVAVGEVIFTSNDGGARWQLQNVKGGIQALTSVVCPTASHCVALGSESAGSLNGSLPGVGVSTNDGGENWQALSMPNGSWNLMWVSCVTSSHCIGSGPAPSTTAQIPFDESSDGGATWSPAPAPAGLTALLSLSCFASHCVGVGASASGPATTETDNGSSWTYPKTGVTP